jgi:AcrR family transcriptional regulator
MPPKIRFCHTDIINSAFNVLRKNGWKSVSARTIAEELNASTTPIYTYLKSMKNLEDRLQQKTLDLIHSYYEIKISDNPLINMGTSFIKFARDEKELFRFFYTEKNMSARFKSGIPVPESQLAELTSFPMFQNLSKDQMLKFLFAGWIFIHGLADLINKSIDVYIKDLSTDRGILEYLSQSFINIWNGMKFISPEDKLDNMPEFFNLNISEQREYL